jgi:hypothetical protein
VLSSGLIRHRRRRRLWRHGGSWGLGGGEMLRKTMRGWAGWVGTCWVAPRGLLVSARGRTGVSSARVTFLLGRSR